MCVAKPEGDRGDVELIVIERECERITKDECEIGMESLAGLDHAAREIDGDHLCTTSRQSSTRSAGSSSDIKDPLSWLRRDDLAHLLSPSLGLAKAEKVIEDVVALRYAIEHARDIFGVLTQVRSSHCPIFTSTRLRQQIEIQCVGILHEGGVTKMRKMRVRTEVLGDLPHLLAVSIEGALSNASPTDPITWVRGDEGMIAFGEYKRIEISGSDRFEKARKWWQDSLRELDIHNNVHGSGTGPILFASFAFDSEEPSTLLIPEVVIGKRGERRWITWFGDGPQPEVKSIKSESAPLALRWSGENGDAWRSHVAAIVDLIQRGEAEKVVLARALDGNIEGEPRIDTRRLLQLLGSDYPNTWLFSNQGLVGATPELLVRLSKSLVTSRVLAGTIKRSGDDEKDLALAASLARSSKDLEEHEYAVRSVADALVPLCSSTNVPESPFVLHLSNVMHLATDVTGVVTDSVNPPDVFDLLARLHPSAAVCGTPRERAERSIREVEEISRGRYAGPVGWVDIRSDGEFGIALRCGQIDESKKSIRIYAGCGIVAGSDPAAEYA